MIQSKYYYLPTSQSNKRVYSQGASKFKASYGVKPKHINQKKRHSFQFPEGLKITVPVIEIIKGRQKRKTKRMNSSYIKFLSCHKRKKFSKEIDSKFVIDTLNIDAMKHCIKTLIKNSKITAREGAMNDCNEHDQSCATYQHIIWQLLWFVLLFQLFGSNLSGLATAFANQGSQLVSCVSRIYKEQFRRFCRRMLQFVGINFVRDLDMILDDHDSDTANNTDDTKTKSDSVAILIAEQKITSFTAKLRNQATDSAEPEKLLNVVDCICCYTKNTSAPTQTLVFDFPNLFVQADTYYIYQCSPQKNASKSKSNLRSWKLESKFRRKDGCSPPIVCLDTVSNDTTLNQNKSLCRPIVSNRYFNVFRLTQTSTNLSGNNRLAIGAFDIHGNIWRCRDNVGWNFDATKVESTSNAGFKTKLIHEVTSCYTNKPLTSTNNKMVDFTVYIDRTGRFSQQKNKQQQLIGICTKDDANFCNCKHFYGIQQIEEEMYFYSSSLKGRKMNISEEMRVRFTSGSMITVRLNLNVNAVQVYEGTSLIFEKTIDCRYVLEDYIFYGLIDCNSSNACYCMAEKLIQTQNKNKKAKSKNSDPQKQQGMQSNNGNAEDQDENKQQSLVIMFVSLQAIYSV